MKLRKTMAIVGLAGAVAAMAVVGTAFAQTPTPPSKHTQGGYQQLFMDKLAAALGTTRDKLDSAFTQARNDTVDQEVKDGKLTQRRADKIKAQKGAAPFGFGFRGQQGKMGGMAFFGGAAAQNAIAEALGMTPQDLRSQLRSGKTLADLAQGKEQAVKDAIVNSVKPKLDQAVKDGKLTQEKETQILDSIQKSDLSKMGGHPGVMGRGAWKGHGFQKQAPAAKPAA